mgnify:CR=1 FL=1
MKPIHALASLLLGLVTHSAQAVVYDRVAPERSRLAFAYKQMGVAMNGGFKRFTAQLAFDPARPEQGVFSLDLDMSSIDAGYPEANAEVVGKDWFDVKRFPQARFVSSGVRALGGNRYEARGTLTIKGKTRPVTAPFTLRADKAGASLDGSFVLKRLDYGIGEGAWGDPGVVADEVAIQFTIATGTASALPGPRKP